MASVQILTNTLETLSNTFDKIPGNLRPTALWLLGTLTIIDFGLLIFKVDEVDWIKTLCRKALKIGFLMYIITDYSTILNSIMDGFILIGSKALDIFETDLIQDPSRLLTKVFELSKPLFPKAGIMTGTKFMFSMTILAMIICALIISMQVFVTWLEFFALTGITIIFIPFAVLDKTAFITEKAFSVLLGLGVKLMILTLMISASTNILGGLHISSETTLITALHILSIIFAIMYLIWKTPSLAAGMMTGNSSLAGSDVIRAGAGVATAAGTAIVAGAGAAGAGMINAGLGAAGKDNLGQMIGGSKAHAAGRLARSAGTGIRNMMSGVMRSAGSTPTAPGGVENSDAYQTAAAGSPGGVSSSGRSASPEVSSSPGGATTESSGKVSAATFEKSDTKMQHGPGNTTTVKNGSPVSSNINSGKTPGEVK